jgi:hypothetical protein
MNDLPDDLVHNPPHYRGEKWEAIEVIEAHGLDYFRATALAYILRHHRKNGAEDIAKARWYLERLADSPLSLYGAHMCASGNPDRSREMHGHAVAADFGITDGNLREALRRLLPDPDEYASIGHILDDVRAAIVAIDDLFPEYEGGAE